MALARRAPILGLAFVLLFPQIAAVPITSASAHSAGLSSVHKGSHKQGKHSHRRPGPITVKVSSGFDESVRSSAWAPVTVTLHNRSNALFNGTVSIPDSASNTMGGPAPQFRTVYQAPVTLPPGTTKQIVLYLPGSDVGNNGVNVYVRQGRTLVASISDSPVTFDDQQLSIGVFTNDPTTTSWLRQDNPLPETPGYVRLTSSTLVPMAGALDSFDVIALSNANIASLDSAQLNALTGYVRDGGGLILVGGPDWQETLRSLPPALIPGHLSGSATVSSLSGLSSLSRKRPPKGRTTLSVLTHPTGMVLAQQGSIPLAVQQPLGQGQILYLAFDPSVDPVLHWSGTGGMLTDFVRRVAPGAITRGMAANGGPAPSAGFFGKFAYGPMNIAGELANVPAAALPSILLFILLTIFYIVLLGPANFLVLRRLHRRELTWVTVPAGALFCLALTFGVAFHLKGNTVLVNTIGFLQLNGTDGPQPLSQYVGLFAPVRGDYTLTDNSSALPSSIPSFYYYGGPQSSGHPLGLRFHEGSQTQVDFVSMNMWSMRSVALQSTVNVTGAIRAQLHVNSKGYIIGAVHNDTRLTLLHPAIIAGRATERIADLPPEGTVSVRIKPNNDVLNHRYGQAIWYQMYGSPRFSGAYYGQGPAVNVGVFAQGGSTPFGGGCCYGPVPPQEKTFGDRIRNAAENIPEAQNIADVGEVTLIGWTTQPFGNFAVDGAAPQRRDLTLVAAPLQVGFSRGPFVLHTGVLGAQLVDQNPQPPLNTCCAQQGQQVFLGPGGWAVFSFTIPGASQIHWKRLDLGVDAGGAYGGDIGSVYDWRKHSWVHEDLTYGYGRLKDPTRFISPSGTMLVRLRASSDSNSIRIGDVHHAIQLRGSGEMT